MTRTKHTLYVEYDEEVSSVISDTQGEDGPYSGFREDVYDYSIGSVKINKPKSYQYEEMILQTNDTVLPSTVYVVIVRYSTGDTFSHSSGRGTIEGVYETEGEANKIKNAINTDQYKGYASWKGYFESLEDCYVEAFEIT